MQSFEAPPDREEFKHSLDISPAEMAIHEELIATEADAYSAADKAHAIAILTEWDALYVWVRLEPPQVPPNEAFLSR